MALFSLEVNLQTDCHIPQLCFFVSNYHGRQPQVFPMNGHTNSFVNNLWTTNQLHSFQ